ncbi:MAG: type II toxin-antitoxin system RelB/DinJ family antitoxin [Bacteroidales bacterium]|nr:type II toxin-antitoxin system RelB/DinJ family antitoxin [Bacteroidales bacterium]MBP5390168.1 type II toxin-antitoxin system RelB/DinJ family antitoxin [Bacteroidales bacterium]
MTSMTIRVDEQLKKSFDVLCDQFGLSNTAALNLFMKAVVRERRIPFEIKADTEEEIRRRGWEAFLQMRETAIKNGAADMTLDEINEEIRASRNENNTIRSH